MHRSLKGTTGALAAILVAAACGGGGGTATTAPAPSTAASAEASASGAAATSAAAAIVADLAAKAKAEGNLNSYGMPPDWTNFGAIWDGYFAKYGKLGHTDTDMSSAEEIQKFIAEQNNPVADQGDIGIQFGPVAVAQDAVQPYIPTRWDVVPDYAKDPNGSKLMGPKPDQLPVAMEFLGRPFEEATLFEIASAYEAGTKHRRAPKGFGPLKGEP